MDCDYTTMLKLDEDFKNGLGIINPFIAGLRTQNYVRLCRMWIDKLIHCAPHERQLRNVYLEQLCRHSQQQVLGTPFNCPPNEGPLQVIPQQYLIIQGVTLSKQNSSKRQLSKQRIQPHQTEETTSWSDVSESSCMTASTWQGEDCGEEYIENRPVKKTASSSCASTTGAETAYTENTHRIHFKHRSKLFTQSYAGKRRSQKKIKKCPGLDSNDELSFKDCYETPIRSKSVASSKRKIVKKIKKTPRIDSCVKISDCYKENKSSGNSGKKKIHERKHAEEEEEDDVEEEKEKEEKEKQLSQKKSVENHTSDSKETMAEMYAIQIKQLENDNQEKITELETEITQCKSENQSLLEQLAAEKDKNQELNYQLDTVKSEIVSLKNKLLLVEKMKNALEEEHKEIITGVRDTLTTLAARVDSAINMNDKIEGVIKKLSSDTEVTVQLFHKEMSAKCKDLEKDYEEKLAELKKIHSQTSQNYENCISKLKKEIVNKNKDKMKLEKKLQEKCSEMRTEVENIKRDIEKSSKENEIQLTAKIRAYKAKIIKLIKFNQKTTEFYEQKINALNKTKDMELWVQKVNVGSALRNSKKQELENIVTSLEEKFRKQLNDVAQRTSLFNEQKYKYEEIASELSSDRGNKSELESDVGTKSEGNQDENKNNEDRQ